MTTQQRTPHPALPHRRAPLLPIASPAMRSPGLAAGLTGQPQTFDAERAAYWAEAMADAEPSDDRHY